MKKYIIFIFFLLALIWVVLGQEKELSTLTSAAPTPKAGTTYTPIATKFTPTPILIADTSELEGLDNVEVTAPLVTGLPALSPTANRPKTNLGVIIPPTSTPYPVEAALLEIQKLTESEPQRRLLGSPPDDRITTRKVSTDGDENDVGVKSSLPRVTGQPRGFVLLYLMHPKARPSVERQVQIMLDSNLENLYLSVLIDGTFTFEEAYLNTILQRLNTDNRTVALQLYLVSGPTMRRWDSTPIETLFSKINPEDYRYFIQEEDLTRNDFKSVARRANSFFDLNKSLNKVNQNYVTVMLEDNLDRDSYRAMRSLAKDVIGDRAVLIRNPCPGCFDGNDTESFGDPIEYHELKDFDKLRVNDAYTLDGVGYRYPDEPGTSGISVEEVKNMIGVSLAQDHKYFGLWRADRQGLSSGATQLDHPDNRNYVVPTEEQARIDISILREGLELVATATPIVQ